MAKKVQSLLTTDLLRKPLFWLLIIILLGGFFRFYNLDWDLQHSFHPDERNILGQTSAIQASAGYKVGFFAYGQLPVYLYRATGELVSTPQSFIDFFRGQQKLAQGVYWAFLVVLFAGILWFFSQKRFALQAFGGSVVIFLMAIFFKWNPTQFTRFDVFTTWFAALDGQRASLSLLHMTIPILPVVCFAFVAIAAFGISALISYYLEMEWVGLPFYSACGVTFLMGVVPAFFPDGLHITRNMAALAFTLILCAGAVWFAWLSRVGRVVLALLAVWIYFASRVHGGFTYTGYGECMLIGRWWSALFSTLTIGAIYIFVHRAYKNNGMALFAAASFAFAVVSIEQAHYCITESFITLMFVVVALCALDIIVEGGWRSYLTAGTAFGLSMAAKTSSLYYVLPIVLAHLIFMAKRSAQEWELQDKKTKANRELNSVLAVALLAVILAIFPLVGYKFQGVIQDLFTLNPSLGHMIWIVLFSALTGLGVVFSLWGFTEIRVIRAQIPQWIKLASAGGLGFFLFCLLSPWSLLDFDGFMSSQNYEWHVVSISDACYVIQFKDSPRYLYHLLNLMHVELWWPLGVVVVAGMVWVLGRFLGNLFRPVKKGYLLPLPFARGKGFAFSLPDLLILCWFIPYFGFIGSWNTKFIRYMVPLVPAFCIFGARFLNDLVQKFKSFPFTQYVRSAVATVVLGASLFYSMAYMHIYSVPHTWIESSVWMFKNVPQGAKIMTETWDDGLPTGVDHQMDSRVEGTMGPQNYGHGDLTIYEMHGFPSDDSPVKRNYYANILQQGDYISIASKKMWYSLTNCTPEFKPHGYNVYPITSRYYRCLWSGLLGFKMVKEFHSFPSFLGWEHPDDMAEESFSVYDHPRVYFFKRFETVSPERILKLLDSDDYVKGINRDIMRTITPDNVDSFIAERHKYLEETGLLKKLDEAAPVTVAAENPAKPAAAAPATVAVAAGYLKKPSKKPNAAGIVPVPVVPTPEIKIDPPSTVPGLPDDKTLGVLKSYADHPMVEDDISKIPEAPEEKTSYQFRAWFSWLFLLIVLGWLALPLTLKVMGPLASGAYSLSKVLGFFVFAWVVWFFTSLKLDHFTVGSCWVWFLLLAAGSAYFYWRDQKSLKALYLMHKQSWLIQEGAFALAFLVFTLVKIYIPNIHDPVGEGYNGGGEAGMDFGFLASVVRGETFPPQNMWMAGLPIGYSFYYGHLMMGILTKTLGLVPAVTYNLALITLFAMIFSCAFGLAFALSGRLISGWIAGFLCAVAGNPAGAKQYMDVIHQCFASMSLGPLMQHTYDFFGPTRVIPPLSINEYPYFSVLYGDMHAHTLAMPFAMLLIGAVASLYMSKSVNPFDFKNDWPVLLTIGFLLGGVAFLNSWEIPVWVIFTGIILVVRHLSTLNGKVLQRGLTIVFGLLVAALTILGWWTRAKPGLDPHAVGGNTAYLVFFVLLGLAGATIWLYQQKTTVIFSKHLVAIAIGMVALFTATGLLWAPFFAGFHPQQSTVLWVLPTIRTSVRNYFNVHGFFLAVILLSFVTAYSDEIVRWMGRAKLKKHRPKPLIDQLLEWLEKMVLPENAVQGMVTLGFATLGVIWGASWIEWTEPPDKTAYSQFLGIVAVGLLLAALYLRKRWELWLAEATLVLLWMAVLVLHGIHLIQDLPFTLNLGFFSLLWLVAFFHLGLAVKVFKNRNLSFAYLLVSCFFFITAFVEIFAMSEYFGFGEGMRNNTLFKYYIIAWEMASITAGVFLPQIFDFFVKLFRLVKKEWPVPRRVMLVFSGFFIFVLLWALLESFYPYMQSSLVYISDIVLVGGILAWGLLEKWFKKWNSKRIFIGVSAALIFISLIASIPQGNGRGLALVQHWAVDLCVGFIFPAALAFALVSLGYLLMEGRKDIGRRMASYGWIALVAGLGLLVSIYPFAASVRKCHGFFNSIRQQWGGFVAGPTLNGLSYIHRSNPGDDAAIRFLNDHVPGQPCLMEFVGAGYNTWGSRMSIFTGIPALMGWDGHVGEWVGARLGDDIRNRVSAVQQIFNTTDAPLAQKMLDAYGVRLVMVGLNEKHGAAEKPGYLPEGLAKFAGFLPLIYKNPQVEIYYNPPPATR